MQNHEVSGAVLQPSPSDSNSFSQPSPSPQPHTSPHPPQRDIDMKPSGPPVGALQAVQQVQAAGPHMVAANYGKSNPIVNPVAGNAVPGVPNRMLNMGNVTPWKNSGYVRNQQPHQSTQPLPNSQSSQHPPMPVSKDIQAWQQLLQILKSPASAQQQQQVLAIVTAYPKLMAAFTNQGTAQQSFQIIGGPNPVPNSIENSTMGPPQIMPNQGPSIANMQRPTKARQQLRQTLKSPTSAQQQQQFLATLKANPKLMAPFIKQGTALQKLQQQQQQMLLNEGNMIAPPPQNVWYKQQHLLAMQRQQQQPNQLVHPSPPMHSQHPPMPVSDTQAWQQLLQILKSPASAQQQEQVLAIVTAYPKLMAAFTNRRTPLPKTHPSVSPQQCILGYPQNPVPSPQQLMQQVSSDLAHLTLEEQLDK